MVKKKTTRKTVKKTAASRRTVKLSDKDVEKGIENYIKSKFEKKCCPPGKFSNIKCTVQKKSCGGCGYFLAFIGAAVYYISTATGFWNGVWGVIKAALWPAFLIFELLKFLGM